jgi:hypothetical protein
MGTRAHGLRHKVRPPHHQQVVGPSRLCHRVDGGPNPNSKCRPRILDAVLQRVSYGTQRGGGVVLISPEGNKFRDAIRLHFPASNNIAEYKGLINGFRIAIDLGATRLYAS